MIIMGWFGGFGGGDVGGFLSQLENFGFFQHVLPFLLIFAVVYAILTQLKIFTENKGAGLIVALAVGLLALQFGIVSNFFQVIFPNLGIGVSIMLVALILAGAFLPWGEQKSWVQYVFFGIGILIFLIVTFSSFSDWQFIGGNWWQEYGGLIILLILIIGAIVGVVLSHKDKSAGH